MRSFIPAAALVAAALVAAPLLAREEPPPGPKLEDVTKLTVRGEAEIEKPADQLRMSIGVQTNAVAAADALRENTQRMNEVIAALAKIGLEKSEYETGRFRIRPQYSERPRQPQPDWRPTIVGYQVVNALTVKTKKLDLAGATIEAANEAGANSIDVAGFQLSEPRMYRAEAIAAATRNALDDAAALAAAAGLRLVRIVAINLDHAGAETRELSFGAQARALAADGGPPPIAPGDVVVRAAVTVVYEIAAGAAPASRNE
jgi:uncharacterized protein YggE